MADHKRDLIYLLIVMIIILFVCVIGYHAFSGKGDTVVIEIDGKCVGEYSLHEEREIYLPDEENHTNVLTIADNKAYMSSADCPDKLCMKQKAISHNKETIVCLPNRIVVTVRSVSSGGEYDTIVQ